MDLIQKPDGSAPHGYYFDVFFCLSQRRTQLQVGGQEIPVVCVKAMKLSNYVLVRLFVRRKAAIS
jgi:hypothetical protein